MELNDRLAASMAHAALTQEALAKRVKVSQQAIQKLLSGKSKSSRRLTEIAIACGVRPAWLASGEGPMADDEPAARNSAMAESDWSDVTGYSQAAGLGEGVEAEEYAETHSLKFKATSLRRKGLHARNLAIYYGKGDSMEPTIKEGDAILFDTSDTRVVDGALYLVQLHGDANAEYYVKRALVLDGIVFFQSDNPAGARNWQKPKRMDSRRNPITVVGRVRWIAGWTD